jgi:DNA polymerase III subunit epsilon
MSGSDSPWHAADLVALDLEGSGAQDRDREAILEIAVVSLAAGQPVLADAYTTLVNPGRPIAVRPWISPGLTNQDLRAAPPISDVEPELSRRMTGRILVGHNVGVDWRLLHRRCPSIAPAGLVDTLRLARTLEQTAARSLNHLVERFNLADQVNVAAPGSAPHRALWDTVAVALLLEHLVRRRWAQPPTLAQLLRVAALPVGGAVSVDHGEVTLF